MKVACPRCGEVVEFEGNPFRPFCGERCKLLDLGKWLTGSYSVPVVEADEEYEAVHPEDSANQ